MANVMSGVEASAAIYHSLKAGHMVTIPDLPSVADGIAGNVDLQTVTFPIIQKYVDDVVLVSEETIKSAIFHLLNREKLLAEGAAAAAFAAVAEGKVRTQGAVVTDTVLPAGFGTVLKNHRTVMAVEAAAFHGERLRRHPDDYQPEIQRIFPYPKACLPNPLEFL